MKAEDRSKAELIKELKTLRKKQGKSALNDFVEYKQNEEKYQSFTKDILDSSAVGMFILDSDFKVVWINHSTEKYFGLQREKVIGKDKRKLIKKNIQHIFEDPDEFIRKVFATYDNNTYVENFECHVLPEGKRKERWLEHWSQPIKSGLYTGGRIEHYYDITERKQAEERVKHLNLVLRAIRNVNKLIIKVKDRESLLKGACESLVKTRGYHNAWIALLDKEGKLKTFAETGLGKAFLPMIELFKKGRPTTCSQRALKQQEVVIIKDPASTCPECPLLKHHSGRRAMTIRLEYDKKVYGVMSVSTPDHLADDQEEQSLFKEIAGDIAFSLHNIELDKEHKQAEENVKNAKDELQIILDSVPAIICYKDIEGKIIRANKTLADSLKMSAKDIIGKTTEELFSKEQAENMRKDDKEVVISGKPKMNITEPYDTPEGTRWAITDKMPCKDKEGKVISLISLSKDITFQKRSEQKLQQTYQRLKKAMDAVINTMSKIIEAKDPYTSGHQHRVCQLAVPLAQELGLSQDKIEGVRIASLIHDIGKIGLPTEILSKPTTLTDIEFNLIKGHSQAGYDILKSIDFSYPVAQIVLQHHERLDGSGYPNKLKGDEILLEARILGVADVVEAMSSHRPYRPALGIDAALEEIIQNRGILYAPEIVDACLKLFKEKEFKFE